VVHDVAQLLVAEKQQQLDSPKTLEKISSTSYGDRSDIRISGGNAAEF
jgi:hypothetical protein